MTTAAVPRKLAVHVNNILKRLSSIVLLKQRRANENQGNPCLVGRVGT